jgi:hypothetical protein
MCKLVLVDLALLFKVMTIMEIQFKSSIRVLPAEKCL